FAISRSVASPTKPNGCWSGSMGPTPASVPTWRPRRRWKPNGAKISPTTHLTLPSTTDPGVVAVVLAPSDSLVQAVARLVDDREATREPSHYDIGGVFERAGVGAGDPHNDPIGAKIGKRKRVSQTLRWALDRDEAATIGAITA